LFFFGLLGYPTEIGDSTLDGDGPPEFYSEEESEACSTYHEFDDADEEDQNSGVGNGDSDEYELNDEDMEYLKWFCSNYDEP